MQGTDREPLATRLTGLAFVMAVVGSFCWLIRGEVARPLPSPDKDFSAEHQRGVEKAKLDLNAGMLALYRGNMSAKEQKVIQLLQDRFGIQARISNTDVENAHFAFVGGYNATMTAEITSRFGTNWMEPITFEVYVLPDISLPEAEKGRLLKVMWNNQTNRAPLPQ